MLTDAMEAKALSHKYDIIDIYSSSKKMEQYCKGLSGVLRKLLSQFQKRYFRDEHKYSIYNIYVNSLLTGQGRKGLYICMECWK